MKVLIEPVLWTYDTLRNGEHPIHIRLTQFRDVKYMGTGYSSSIDHWDGTNNLPKATHPKFKSILKEITRLTEEASFEVKLADKQGEMLTMSELKKRVIKKSVPPATKKVLAFFDEIIKELEDAGRIGYADVFTACKATIHKLFAGKDKPFTAVTEKDFKSYDQFISTLKTESTKSLYVRTFYRLWNLAIERKHCPEQHHPKFHLKYKAYKKIKTKKRAISFDYIQKIESLHFEYHSRLYRSQQYLIFSYYSRGINFSDLAKLKHVKNVFKGHLYYKRSKNKREYHFELHPKAKAVVQLFQDYPLQSDGSYVFPILGSAHNTPRKIDTRIESALKDFNEDLAIIEQLIDSPKHITSYVIRHAFATNLRHRNVDIAIIKEAMGHESEHQTNTYLEEIDDSVVAKSIEDALK